VTKRYPMPLPFGWFAAMMSDELALGQAKPLKLFGQEMVIFRTESGAVKVLDAYCPHMGAHLGYGIHEFTDKGGEVRGETVVCPFHGWRFDGNGVCVDVPYAKNMPPKVQGKECLKVWPVVEKNQFIWIWYHPENQAPAYQIDDLPEADINNPEWGTAEVHRSIIRTHIQDIAENGSDPAHFRYVHGTAEIPMPIEVAFDGHRRHALFESRMNTPKGQIIGRIAFFNVGPGQAVTRFSGICDTVLQGYITPIDEDSVQVIFHFMQKKVSGEVKRGGVTQALIEDIKKQLREDTPIWEHKKYWPMPILCDGDGPISKFRKWYGQFYVGYEEKPSADRLQHVLAKQA